jgi:hypothetical protein
MRIPAAMLPHEKYARPCARGPRTRLNLPVVCCARLIKSHSRPQLLYIQAYVYIYIYCDRWCVAANPHWLWLGLCGVRQMNAFEMRGNGRTDGRSYIECPVRERVGFKEPKRRSH